MPSGCTCGRKGMIASWAICWNCNPILPVKLLWIAGDFEQAAVENRYPSTEVQVPVVPRASTLAYRSA